MYVLAISSSPSTTIIRPIKRNGLNRPPVRKILCLSQRRQSKTGTGKSWIVPTSLSLFGSGFVLGPLLDGLHSRVDLVVYKNGAFQIGPLHTNIWVIKKPKLCKSLHRHSLCCCCFSGAVLAWLILLHSRFTSTPIG